MKPTTEKERVKDDLERVSMGRREGEREEKEEGKREVVREKYILYIHRYASITHRKSTCNNPNKEYILFSF